MAKYYLGIETSCDETGAAVVVGEFNILSNVIASQIDIHKQFGGVVPEIASRNHIENIVPVLDTALKQAGISLSQIDKVFATAEPGLPGAVMVGRCFGESIAAALNIEYGAINHLYGHIAGLKLSNRGLVPPFMCLLVSGGHTAVYNISSNWKTKLLLSTADDAAGECFDKVGRVLGLEYPAGPKIAKLAENYDGENGGIIKFVSKFPKDRFSFSGLKTAVLNFVNTEKAAGRKLNIPQICASFQSAVTEQLVNHSIALQKKYRTKQFGVCGGVAANKFLCDKLQSECGRIGVKFFTPLHELCGDNAAMISAAGMLNIV
jgi:N6-L-threonylcarbamoyladenine synthase